MSALTAAQRYARALYEVTRPEDRQQTLEEFGQAVEVLQDDAVQRFFFHPKTPLKEKRRAVTSMGLNDGLQRFFYMVLEKGRETDLQGIHEAYRQMVHLEAGISSATVASAVRLDETTLEEIRNRLSSLTGGRTIDLKAKVDETIIGGLVLEVDGKVIDGSLAAQLERFRKALRR